MKSRVPTDNQVNNNNANNGGYNNNSNNGNGGVKLPRPILIELFAALTVYLVALVFLLVIGSMTGIAFVIMGTVWTTLIKNTRQSNMPLNMMWKTCITHLITMGIIFVILLSFPLMSMGNTGKWRYPLEKSYVQLRHTCRLAEWYPDKLPKDAENCRMDYLPSIMQGNGYFAVSFDCGDSTAAEWENFGKENAAYIVPLSDYAANDGGHFDPTGYAVSADNNVQSSDPTLDVFYYEDMWKGCEEDSVIYVIYTNLDFNHAHTEAVIVNRKDGKVGFFTE